MQVTESDKQMEGQLVSLIMNLLDLKKGEKGTTGTEIFTLLGPKVSNRFLVQRIVEKLQADGYVSMFLKFVDRNDPTKPGTMPRVFYKITDKGIELLHQQMQNV